MGIFFAIACAVTWAAAVVLFKTASEEIHPIIINACKNWVGTLLMIPTVLIFAPFSFADIAQNDLIILIVSGVLGIGLADALVLKSLEAIGASKFAVVECTYSPFVIIVAILILGESLNLVQVVGVILVLSAIFVISVPNPSVLLSSQDELDAKAAKQKRSRLGIVLGIIGFVAMAVGITVVKPLFDRIPLIVIVFIRLLAGSVASLVFVKAIGVPLSQLKQFFTIEKKIPFYCACVLSTYISMLFWVSGFKYNDVSIASVLNQTSTVFTVLFAAIFLKEKLTKKLLTAVGMAIAGVLIVTLNT